MNAYLKQGDIAPLRAKLGTIYGTNPEVSDLDDEATVELGQNLRRGVPIATPVFDGAHEAISSSCWNKPGSMPPVSRRSTTGARANPSTAK